MKLRIKFKKEGAMKFIGHLDIMRYFQKAVRRAQIDVCYSSGFSPHQVMSFAAPLGVGFLSTGEYFDLEVSNAESSIAVMDALNKEMTEGIEILSVVLLPDNAKNAMASVAAASYYIAFRKGYEMNIDLESQIPLFLQKTSISVMKQTKKSTIEIDIRPFIYEMKVWKNGIYMTVDASSSNNLKPALVMQAFLEECGIHVIPDFTFETTRIETYTVMNQLEKITLSALVPLSMMGAAF